MTRRLTHWAVGSGILSEMQAAFIPQHGCGSMSTCSPSPSAGTGSRAATPQRSSSTCARRTYDLVHADSLYPLLHKMGVSEDLVRLLESRSS